MTTKNVDINFRAQIQDLTRTLASVPGITEKDAKAMASALEKHVKRAEQATKKSATAAEREWNKRLGDIRRASASVFGGVVNDVDDVVQGLGAIGPAGLIAGAGVAAIAGGVVAIGAGVAGVVKLVSVTDDLLKRAHELDRFGFDGFLVPPEAEASVLRANAALTAIRDTAGAAAAAVGTELSPTVERVATLLVAAGLAGVDALNAVGTGADVVTAAVRGLIQGALEPMLWTVEMTATAWSLLIEGLGGEAPEALKRAQHASEELAGVLTGGLGAGFEALEFAAGDYLAQAEDLIDAEGRAAAATGKHVSALDEKKKQLEELHKLQELQVELTERTREAEERAAKDSVAQTQAQHKAQLALASQRQEWADADVGNQERLADAAEERWAREVDAIATWVGYAQQAIDQIAQMVMDHHGKQIDVLQKELAATKGVHTEEARAKRDSLREQIREQKKAALTAFRVTQGASIVQAGIMGLLSALTWSQPPPVGIGFPQGAVAAGVQTATTIAGIAAQKPPTFHIGRAGLAPDEQAAVLTRTESVATARGTRALGGPEVVRAANRGQLDGNRDGGATVIALNDRVIEQIAHRMLGLSSVRRAVVGLTARKSGGY